VPFSVQCSYILPWKILTTFSTIVVLPPHHLPDRSGWIFHDWNFLTVLIIGHNLGDTLGSAIVANLFDSVVKAVCGVLSIILPTWSVSYLAGWETIAWHTTEGQLKVSGATIVVFASLAYTLGRSWTSFTDTLLAQLQRMEEEPGSLALKVPLKNSNSQGIEMQAPNGLDRSDCDLPTQGSKSQRSQVSTVYEDEEKAS